MQFAGLEFVAGSYFLMSPRAVCDGSFEQRAIFKFVSENRFEEVQIGSRFGIFQDALDYNKRRKLVEKCDALPALGG